MLASMSGRLNTFLLALIVVMAAAIIGILATRAGAGPLDPPGPPASTGRNMIFQPASCAAFPIVISAPGSYQLGGDITGCSGKDGIQITTGNVTLDLASHNVNGGGFTSGSLTGIKNVGANGQIVVRNGQVQQWGQTGVDLTSSSVALVDNVIATYNGDTGIALGSASAVTNSTASANAHVGILTAGSNNRIAGCQADSNTGNGVYLLADGTTVEDCEVSGNFKGVSGGNIERIERNHIHNNSSDGIYVGTSSTVDENSVFWNGGVGVWCIGNNCAISHNAVGNNNNDGIYVGGAVGVVVDNDVVGNAVVGIFIASPSAGYPNVAARNVATGNAGGNYVVGANNDSGPQGTAAAASSAANYSQ